MNAVASPFGAIVLELEEEAKPVTAAFGGLDVVVAEEEQVMGEIKIGPAPRLTLTTEGVLTIS